MTGGEGSTSAGKSPGQHGETLLANPPNDHAGFRMKVIAFIAPLMSEGWRDILSIVSFTVGIVSLGVTVVGLLYAIAQIRKTKSAVDAAKEAADEAVAESKRSYHRYAAGNAQRLIKEAKIHVDNKAWALAAFRLNDLADQVAQLASEDAAWRQLADTLRKWETACQGQARGVKKGFAVLKWSEFIRRLQAKIDEWSGPFPTSTQEASDDT